MNVNFTENDEKMLSTLRRDPIAEAHARNAIKKNLNFGAYLASAPRTMIVGHGNFDSDPRTRLQVVLLLRLLQRHGIEVLGLGVHENRSWALRVTSADSELLNKAVLYCWFRVVGSDHRYAEIVSGDTEFDVPYDFEI